MVIRREHCGSSARNISLYLISPSWKFQEDSCGPRSVSSFTDHERITPRFTSVQISTAREKSGGPSVSRVRRSLLRKLLSRRSSEGMQLESKAPLNELSQIDMNRGILLPRAEKRELLITPKSSQRSLNLNRECVLPFHRHLSSNLLFRRIAVSWPDSCCHSDRML